jgi:hypothetical protein
MAAPSSEGLPCLDTLDWNKRAADAGLERLRHDIETGEWDRRYADLLALDAYDAGYRLVISGN